MNPSSARCKMPPKRPRRKHQNLNLKSSLMAELHHILGSLFSDIAQSVFTSDLYSRDISRYYEQDGLLRHFPVPRTEISELEVELKFAIAGVELNPTQSIGREANAATLFIDYSYNLSESFYDAL